MSRPTELTELHHLITSMQRCVNALQSQYGNSVTMRRIVNDTERIMTDVQLLAIDTEELDLHAPPVEAPSMEAPPPHHNEKIPIPDTPYDATFWHNVDDEGVGGHSRH